MVTLVVDLVDSFLTCWVLFFNKLYSSGVVGNSLMPVVSGFILKKEVLTWMVAAIERILVYLMNWISTLQLYTVWKALSSRLKKNLVQILAIRKD